MFSLESNNPTKEPINEETVLREDGKSPDKVVTSKSNDPTSGPTTTQESLSEISLRMLNYDGESCLITRVFTEAFDEIQDYQNQGLKKEAVKRAMQFYKFWNSEDYKDKIHYLDDNAWKSLENNILEGSKSLASTGHGFSALHFFSLIGIARIVYLLLEKDADYESKAARVYSSMSNDEYRRPKGLSGLVKSFSKGKSSKGFDPTLIDWTPLHFTSAYSGDPDTIQLLLDRGTDVNAKTSKGLTPLALINQKAEFDEEIRWSHGDEKNAIRILLDSGGRMNVIGEDGALIEC